MHRTLTLLLAFVLTGCGVEVAGTAAVTGAAQVQDARQAKQTMEQVRQRLDAANQTAQQQLEDADKATGQ